MGQNRPGSRRAPGFGPSRSYHRRAHTGDYAADALRSKKNVVTNHPNPSCIRSVSSLNNLRLPPSAFDVMFEKALPRWRSGGHSVGCWLYSSWLSLIVYIVPIHALSQDVHLFKPNPPLCRQFMQISEHNVDSEKPITPHRQASHDPSPSHLQPASSREYLTLDIKSQTHGSSHSSSQEKPENHSTMRFLSHLQKQLLCQPTLSHTNSRPIEVAPGLRILEGTSKKNTKALDTAVGTRQALSPRLEHYNIVRQRHLVFRWKAIIRLHLILSQRLLQEHGFAQKAEIFSQWVAESYERTAKNDPTTTYIQAVVPYALKASFLLGFLASYNCAGDRAKILDDVFYFFVRFWTSVLAEKVKERPRDSQFGLLSDHESLRRAVLYDTQQKLRYRKSNVREKHVSLPWLAVQLWLQVKQPKELERITDGKKFLNRHCRGFFHNMIIRLGIHYKIDINIDLHKLLDTTKASCHQSTKS
ncbi:hypothetical protein O181_032555 [Austropuccinia psidii MF-1]|uniref:Uncharacterized protein n=1 Tax=Austropuccinia psidii MF-1 TaxID=1389203 RepID=A0A9Q3CZU2_9BASI|nr:hypothetical protein [Austropuccinia psidii MF-1]